LDRVLHALHIVIYCLKRRVTLSWRLALLHHITGAAPSLVEERTMECAGVMHLMYEIPPDKK